ncbi:MAG: sigma-70 family RNA polymerase sigma factor [Anaerolineae bacterium]|nr:sigma-70 family RNA polymerase sigma factor [Anaerolineae bacterium]
MSDDETKLIQQAKQGDPAAFTEIYEQCQPAIYRYIFYQVGDAATAEDLTSEVFVRLVDKIDRFTYRGRPLLAWLYTIARNLITDHHRRVRQSQPLELEKQLIADAIDVEESIEDKLAQRRVIAAIARLTEEQRQVILLRFVEGLDNASTASILGKSVNAVKALQHRALAALRRILESDEHS